MLLKVRQVKLMWCVQFIYTKIFVTYIKMFLERETNTNSIADLRN